MIAPLQTMALLLIVVAQAPRIEDVQQRRAFDEAQEALMADPNVQAAHRGLNAFLAANDDLRQVEENFRALMELPTFRIAQEDFEEVLLADADARRDYRRYIARLARDSHLREAIAGLMQTENNAPSGVAGLSEALAYLRAHPQVALAMTAGPVTSDQLPLEVRPVREAFRRNAVFRDALGAAWAVLHAESGARESVYPWWGRAYGGSAAGLRYRALEAELAPFASHALAWEQREFAWAAQLLLIIDWRDHVYALARRNPALEPVYFEYLGILRTRPDVAAYAEKALTALYGPAPPWPPAGLPPSLPPWKRPGRIDEPTAPTKPTLDTPGTPTVRRPERPTVERPTGPTRPVAPERAQPATSP